MITSMPRCSADFANSNNRSGVRWAETIFVSCATSNSSSVCEAISIVGQSDLLPMMIATSGLLAINSEAAPRFAAYLEEYHSQHHKNDNGQREDADLKCKPGDSDRAAGVRRLAPQTPYKTDERKHQADESTCH